MSNSRAAALAEESNVVAQAFVFTDGSGA